MGVIRNAGGEVGGGGAEEVLCTHQWLFKLEEVNDGSIGEQLVGEGVTRKVSFGANTFTLFVLI